jgi:hypothetical protein
LFAFAALERDENGMPTDDSEVGGALQAQALAAVIELRDMVAAYFDGLIKGAAAAEARRRA